MRVRAEVQLLSDGRSRLETMKTPLSAGPTAVLTFDNFTVVVFSQSISLFDRAMYYANGLDPGRFRPHRGQVTAYGTPHVRWMGREKLQCRRGRFDLGKLEKSRSQNLREANLPAGRGRHFQPEGGHLQSYSDKPPIAVTLMKIDAVDFFYLSMPEVTTEADGSQDALLVRVSAGGLWGGASARRRHSHPSRASSAPCLMGYADRSAIPYSGSNSTARPISPVLPRRSSITAWTCCKRPTPSRASRWPCGTFLARRRDAPVWTLLGYSASHKKTPYASQLFGNTPEETLRGAQKARRDNFTAVKFGWGPIGRGTVKDDTDHFQAAREGLGPDGILLVDVGQIWGEDVGAAKARLPLSKPPVQSGSRNLFTRARSMRTGNWRS